MNKAGQNIVEAKPDPEAKASTATESEVNETLAKLLKGEEIFEVLDTRRGKFKIIFPRPRVLRQIQLLLAQRFNGQDLNKILEKTIRQAEIYASLDVVVVEGPKWWDKLETSEDCPDDDFILDLYRGYLQFYGTVQRKIRGSESRPGEIDSESSSESKKEAVGTGAFSDIAHGPEDEGANG
jgi:hypothetical protein